MPVGFVQLARQFISLFDHSSNLRNSHCRGNSFIFNFTFEPFRAIHDNRIAGTFPWMEANLVSALPVI